MNANTKSFSFFISKRYKFNSIEAFQRACKNLQEIFYFQHANVPGHEKAIKLTTMKILKVSE